MENGRHRVVKHFRFTETEAAKLRKLIMSTREVEKCIGSYEGS